jgi:uncharacterized protein YigE (DUF2233 family)
VFFTAITSYPTGNCEKHFKKNKVLNMHLKFVQGLIYSLIAFSGLLSPVSAQETDENDMFSYVADPKSQKIQLYWKDDRGEIIRTIQNLKSYVESKGETLIFGMNGGMYQGDYSAVGLLIIDKVTFHPINISSGGGNFYLKPNGVFCITTDNHPFICKTEDFKDNGKIKYATQSGPMLLIDGAIHPAFNMNSTNCNIRNGVGILPSGKILFAMSKTPVTFYQFARFFNNQGCKNALFLDGVVSEMYLPEMNLLHGIGNFGVLIGVTKKNER